MLSVKFATRPPRMFRSFSDPQFIGRMYSVEEYSAEDRAAILSNGWSDRPVRCTLLNAQTLADIQRFAVNNPQIAQPGGAVGHTAGLLRADFQ